MIVALLTGCRYRFDARSTDAGDDDASPDTAVTGHDEDADGLPDSIDPCPHIAGDTADQEGDGVGDACDPNPTLATEHWSFFSSLSENPFDTALEQRPDSLHSVGSLSFLLIKTLQNARVDLGFTINAQVGTGQHQVAFGLESPVLPYYFAELNENGSLKNFNLASYDGTSYVSLDSKPFASLHPGTGSLRIDMFAGGVPYWVATGGWVGELYSLQGNTPSYTGGTQVRFSLNGVDIDLLYLAIIETTP